VGVPGRAGGKKFAKLEVWAAEVALGSGQAWCLELGVMAGGGGRRPQPAGEVAGATFWGGTMGSATAGFWTGWSFKVVIMTIILEEFSGGPWTSAVQGPK